MKRAGSGGCRTPLSCPSALTAGSLGDARVEFAFVFGSVAAGAARGGSDVDLLVVGTDGLRSIVARLRCVQEAIAREVTPIVWTPKEYASRRKRGDHFLSRVLSEPRLMVVGADPAAHP